MRGSRFGTCDAREYHWEVWDLIRHREILSDLAASGGFPAHGFASWLKARASGGRSLHDVSKTFGHADSWEKILVRAVVARFGQRSVGGGEADECDRAFR